MPRGSGGEWPGAHRGRLGGGGWVAPAAAGVGVGRLGGRGDGGWAGWLAWWWMVLWRLHAAAPQVRFPLLPLVWGGDGRWPMANGRWPMDDGRWPMADR